MPGTSVTEGCPCFQALAEPFTPNPDRRLFAMSPSPVHLAAFSTLPSARRAEEGLRGLDSSRVGSRLGDAFGREWAPDQRLQPSVEIDVSMQRLDAQLQRLAGACAAPTPAPIPAPAPAPAPMPAPARAPVAESPLVAAAEKLLQARPAPYRSMASRRRISHQLHHGLRARVQLF